MLSAASASRSEVHEVTRTQKWWLWSVGATLLVVGVIWLEPKHGSTRGSLYGVWCADGYRVQLIFLDQHQGAEKKDGMFAKRFQWSQDGDKVTFTFWSNDSGPYEVSTVVMTSKAGDSISFADDRFGPYSTHERRP